MRKCSSVGFVIVLMLFSVFFAVSCSSLSGEMQQQETKLIDEYRSQCQALAKNEGELVSKSSFEPIPSDFSPWWQNDLQKSLEAGTTLIPETLSNLTIRAITHSSQIRVFSDIPAIRETAIAEANGRFGVQAFVDGKRDGLDQPVGSVLTSRTQTHNTIDSYTLEGGVRKQFATGAQLEIAEKVGRVDNNSEYFAPTNQAQTRFSINLAQPLLRGGGFEYNMSPINLAKIDAKVGLDEFRRQASSHLLELSRAYWELYAERALLLHKTKLVDEASVIVKEMEQRANLDALASQVARARSSFATRSAELIRMKTAVRNAQSRIYAMVNDPALSESSRSELIPTTVPTWKLAPVDTESAFLAALVNRPEIDQALKQVQAGAIRLKMSKNELLPVLNLVCEAYVDGLQGDYDVSSAIDQQTRSDYPNYSVGFIFSMPLTAEAERARYLRNKLELRQMTEQFRTTVETVMLEVKVSIRELDTAHKELESHYHAMVASLAELKALELRRDLITAAGENGSLYLEHLIDAQERVASSEERFVTSLATYNVAILNMEHAKGVLLAQEHIGQKRIEKDHIPAFILQKLEEAAVQEPSKR